MTMTVRQLCRSLLIRGSVVDRQLWSSWCSCSRVMLAGDAKYHARVLARALVSKQRATAMAMKAATSQRTTAMTTCPCSSQRVRRSLCCSCELLQLPTAIVSALCGSLLL